MKPDTINKIYLLSFYEPWNNFYRVMSKIGKNTKLIKTILPTQEYQQFYKYFNTPSHYLRLGETVPEDMCIEIK